MGHLQGASIVVPGDLPALPAARAPSAGPAARPAAPPIVMTTPASPRARVLVVEDHDDLAEALELNLRRDGHDVLRARDGRDALLIARQQAVDLVVLDLGLPRVDGLTVLDKLRGEGH